jgi:hypothetical protein
MQNSLLAQVAALPPAEVIAGLEREVRAERGATARVIAWLVEVERRKLYLDAGFSSLFSYCVEALGFSEDMLEARSITMTTARLLFQHLKGHPDPAAVLRSAAGRSRREVERIIAELTPRPDVVTSIRKVPASPTPPAVVASATRGAVAANAARPSSPAHIAPLSPDRYHLQVTISGSAVEKLELAQDMLSHALPKPTPPPSWSRRSTFCWRIWHAVASRRRAHPGRTGRSPPTRDTSRPRSSVRCGSVTVAGARS